MEILQPNIDFTIFEYPRAGHHSPSHSSAVRRLGHRNNNNGHHGPQEATAHVIQNPIHAATSRPPKSLPASRPHHQRPPTSATVPCPPQAFELWGYLQHLPPRYPRQAKAISCSQHRSIYIDSTEDARVDSGYFDGQHEIIVQLVRRGNRFVRLSLGSRPRAPRDRFSRLRRRRLTRR